MKTEWSLRGRLPRIQLLPALMTLGKLLRLTELSEPQFPHLQNGHLSCRWGERETGFEDIRSADRIRFSLE